MSSNLDALLRRRPDTRKVQLRSIISGRQRWEIGLILNQSRVAQLLEMELRRSPSVKMVRANPVTGRLLVCHDPAVPGDEVEHLVRTTLALAVRQTTVAHQSLVSVPVWQQIRKTRRRPVEPAVGLAGGAVLVWVLGRSLRNSPLVRLGTIAAATGIVVRRAWRRSARSARSTRHPLLRIVRSHRRKLYLASTLSMIGQILEMAPVVLIGAMASVLISGESSILIRLGLASTSSQLWFLTGMTALVCLVTATVSFIATMLWRDLAQFVQHEWRTEMYAQVQRVGIRFLEDERITKLARVLTDDVNQMGRFIAHSASYFVQLGTGLVILLPMFLFLAPGLAWIAFLPVPVIVWLSFYHQHRAAPDYATSSENESRLNSQLFNNLEAGATIKSFVTEKYEIGRIDRLSERCLESHHRTDLRTTTYTETVRVCTMASLVGTLLLGGRQVLSGALPFGVFNPLIGLPQIVLWKLPALGDATEQYQRTVGALERVLDLRHLPVEPGQEGRHLEMAQVSGDMVLDGVTFAYPGRPPILRDVSLRIAARRTTGIVGVTGAGKTTIAKLLLRFYDPVDGRVLLDGVDLRELNLQDLRMAIGFVGQDAFLFDGTVRDNIRYGSFDADLGKVVEAAQLAEADSFVEALPSRYDTSIGERGVTLSGGQKQRVSLARAILKDAPIVILDEATSAVDNETEAAIQRALKDFARDRTMVIIAHRLSTIRHADWIYVMGQGGVISEEGTHHELLERDGVYAALWRLQIGEAVS